MTISEIKENFNTIFPDYQIDENDISWGEGEVLIETTLQNFSMFDLRKMETLFPEYGLVIESDTRFYSESDMDYEPTITFKLVKLKNSLDIG